jgi:hypothetical protein
MPEPDNVMMIRGGPTPPVLLNHVSSRSDEFENILIMGVLKDGGIATTWSTMSISQLCLISKSLDAEIYDLLEDSRGAA